MSTAAPLDVGATVQTELASAPALRPSQSGAGIRQLCGSRLTAAIVICSVVADVIASPSGRVILTRGWGWAGSAEICAGPVDSPERQERTASAAMKNTTANRA